MGRRSNFDEVLLTLLWAGEKAFNPTLRSLTETFEGWQWRHGFARSLGRAVDRGLLRRMQRADQIVYNVTDLGRIAAMGGVDLAARWQRAWDGRWRQVLFDLPASRRQLRLRLWRWLRANGFGYLQNSVWIHPDPIEDVIEALAEFREDVETFLIMEASCCRGYSEQAIVAGAWDFEEINKRHRAYIETASLTGREVASFKCSPTALRSWLKRERIAWEYALQADPLLPRVLWPAEYLGERAWGVRKRSYRQLAESLAEGE